MRRIALLKTTFAAICISLCCQSFAAIDYVKTPAIRTLILANQEKLLISGVDVERTLAFTGKRHTFAGNQKFSVNCKDLNLPDRLSGSPVMLARLTSKTGLLSVNGEQFAGNIYVASNSAHTGCDVINEGSIEQYIASLLSKEMNSSWHPEALKAQAVAARTYAMYKIRERQNNKDRLYDVINSEFHQVGGNFFDATIETVRAAKATRGQILLTKNDHLTETFFHASCGGETMLPDRVWSNHVEGYEAVQCGYCKHSHKRSYKRFITNNEFNKFLAWNFPNLKTIKNVKIIAGSMYDDYLHIKINRKVYDVPKSNLRRFMGARSLPSNTYALTTTSNGFAISGKGHGHGVGMCQVGAFAMAREGKTYAQILKHYYPNHDLHLIYR